MNLRVQNIATLIDPKFTQVGNAKLLADTIPEESKLEIVKRGRGESVDQYYLNSGKVHMYQHDIVGNNAIDYAFQANAIFCIKAFVESLLILPEEV